MWATRQWSRRSGMFEVGPEVAAAHPARSVHGHLDDEVAPHDGRTK